LLFPETLAGASHEPLREERRPDMRRAAIATFLVVALLALPGPRVEAADRASGPVSQSDLEQALAAKVRSDDVARDTLRQLLERKDVQELAKGYGLDARQAEAAVGTLQGEELQRLAAQAATVNAQLAGGDEVVVRMSLVALLLIVIIVILLTR
jgi:hypothetical protein